MLLRHRHRGAIKKVLKVTIKYGGYAIVVCLCGFIIYSPEFLVKKLFPPLTSSVEDTSRDVPALAVDRTTLLAPDPTQSSEERLRMAAAFRKLANFLFLSTERKCENLFALTRRGPKLTYSGSYWEYVDSYKNALSAAGVLKEGRTNEESWTIHEIAKSPFVRTVCLTGFNGGLSAFMCLTANPNLKVYAFDEQRYNYTKELATYMSWEFYDRFTIKLGNTRHTIAEFVRARPAFRCDVFIVDGSRTREKLEGDFKDVARLANPAGNIVVVELYAADDAARVWESYKERSDVKEHFMCKFNELDVLSMRSRSHVGFAVGSYVNK